jgi:hypothetical protein
MRAFAALRHSVKAQLPQLPLELWTLQVLPDGFEALGLECLADIVGCGALA